MTARRRPLGSLAAVAAVAAAAWPARAQPIGYARAARVAALDRAIAAVRGLGPGGRRDLDAALYRGTRERCRAALGAPPVACTIDVARAYCATRTDRAACDAAADVVLVNQRAATELVDEPTRLRLVAAAADYHAALGAELEIRYATIAAAFALAEPTATASTRAALAARVDRFCAAATRGGTASPVPDYPRCAAALVWYVAPRLEAP